MTVKEADPSPPPPPAGGGWGEGAPQAITMLSRARALRRESTPAERKLWQKLRNHQLNGLKFRRQVPLGRYIADFYCATAQLVIELDGISHIELDEEDVVRHRLVKAIIKAYERDKQEQEGPQERHGIGKPPGKE